MCTSSPFLMFLVATRSVLLPLFILHVFGAHPWLKEEPIRTLMPLPTRTKPTSPPPRPPPSCSSWVSIGWVLTSFKVQETLANSDVVSVLVAF